jgi:hypothetical protein
VKDLASLVPFQRAVGVELIFENPFAGDDIGANGRGTRSQVLLAIKAANSSSMARRQFGSIRVAWMEEGTSDKIDVQVADRVSLSAGSWKPHFPHMVIG